MGVSRSWSTALGSAASGCVALLLVGCGGAEGALRGPLHDVPVAAGEPRAELRLKVALRPGPGCEEAFDLALYEDRGVDLIAWDGQTGACHWRAVTIRYLPRRTSEGALLNAVRKLASGVEKTTAAPETAR
ncbi:hypothetical protein [Chondromyces apiculatus]|uniref:Lipoprotein n=1 Tax=Chondromyces apiculatus DSM 436 TaxID=1192034 RepID=A0A017T819_9BACT|nr:hypothetical protein [Chondromyces apiculatus]EYF04741.1 Hypothetical protein CAP_4217 [Chondromyces apiculatus DSM 436]